MDRYDAGLLNDWGGGNVDWWWDYIRSELDAAHHFYESLSSPTAVKPLTWKASNDPSEGRVHYGKGVFGHWYGVCRRGRGVWSVMHTVDGKTVHLPLQGSLEEAKDSADEDYVKTIMSVLR